MSQRAPARLTVTVTDIGAKVRRSGPNIVRRIGERSVPEVIGAFELDQDAQEPLLAWRTTALFWVDSSASERCGLLGCVGPGFFGGV